MPWNAAAFAALQDKGTARWVRTIRVSVIRKVRNRAILHAVYNLVDAHILRLQPTLMKASNLP